MILSVKDLITQIEQTIEANKEKIRRNLEENSYLTEEIIGLEDILFKVNNYFIFDKSYYDYLDDLKKNLIVRALSKSEGNVLKASELLQMSRSSLIEQIQKFNIDKRSFKE